MTDGLTVREVLEIGGLRLAYRLDGIPDASSTVVLLHGWGASLETLAGIRSCLAPEHRVISFDLPGFGESARPPEPWGSAQYAALLEHAFDKLDVDRANLIGHSFGGKISILIATRRPDLVQRLVLVNSAGIRPPRTLGREARIAAYRTARRVADPAGFGDWLAGRFGSADYRNAGPLRATLVRVVNEDVRPLLGRVAAPTLLIWGDRDEETPIFAAAIMEREIPDAGLIVFPGAGHYSFVDDPQRFCRVVGNFLKS